MIEAEALVKSYGKKRVLRAVSFIARPGEITLLVGPNGAGKSTIMKLLSGLARPDAGRVVIAGRDMGADRVNTQRELSFLPQMPNFHPRFTCAQIVAFYAKLRGFDSSRAEHVLEIGGLREMAREQTRALSGGMRQRLALALLLLPDVRVLLLDEPGLSLDAEWRGRMQQLLREQAARGKAILITTHLLAEWNNTAHRCLVCRDGAIDGEADPARLVEETSKLPRSVPPPSGERPGNLSATTQNVP
jgi:ABC-2 type transport system ATP-binding protein